MMCHVLSLLPMPSPQTVLLIVSFLFCLSRIVSNCLRVQILQCNSKSSRLTDVNSDLSFPELVRRNVIRSNGESCWARLAEDLA